MNPTGVRRHPGRVAARPAWLDQATVQALLLTLIAGVYIGFAVADGRPTVIAVESSVAGAFVVLAAAGVTGQAWLLVLGYAGHGLKDFWQERSHYVAGTRWWPPFCAAVDWLVAVVLAIEIIAGAGFHHPVCPVPCPVSLIMIRSGIQGRRPDRRGSSPAQPRHNRVSRRQVSHRGDDLAPGPPPLGVGHGVLGRLEGKTRSMTGLIVPGKERHRYAEEMAVRRLLWKSPRRESSA